MLNLCYLNMIRCDDCVTSYMDAVHESLIEVLGCSTRLGGDTATRFGEPCAWRELLHDWW